MKKVSNLVVGLSIAAIFLIALLLIPIGIEDATEGVLGARYIPRIVFSIGLVMAIVMTVLYRRETFEIDLGVAPMALEMFAYYFGVKYIGFLPATALIMICFALTWKVRDKVRIALLTILTVVAIYLVFTVALGVSLPKGMIFK